MDTIDMLYKEALLHQQSHGCGAVPYDRYKDLIMIAESEEPANILEIGTGVGFTAMALAMSLPSTNIDTLEMNSEHVIIAQQLFDRYRAGSGIHIINDIAEFALPEIQKTYDMIFFDGFQVHYEFLKHYQRLLRSGGLLVLANTDLASKTSSQFFEEMSTSGAWQLLQKFEDTMVIRRL